MLESAKSQVGHMAWPCALQHSTLIKNVVPHSSLPVGVSPFKLWMGNKPSASTICTFGCKAMVAVPEKQHDKLVSCKGCPSWKSHTPCVILTLSSLGGTLPPTSIQSEFARITATAIVDVVVICPMQAEDGHPLEPRICQLHPIPFPHILSPF